MKIVHAGITIDVDILEQLKNGEDIDEDQITPETISAAYARISRDPRDVTELRRIAMKEVEKARRSNRNIVFGLGHHSVAEHAYINFDVMKISRLAVEWLEAHRISVAYTEKSQRYIRLDGDYVIPLDLKSIPHRFTKAFHYAIKRQNELYHLAVPLLIEFHKEKNPDLEEKDWKSKSTEDARYIVSLATEAQLGFSVNFRELEYIIRKARHHPLEEIKELGDKLFEIGSKVAPSLIKLCDPVAFKKEFNRPLEERFFKNFRNTLEAENNKIDSYSGEILPRANVELIDFDENGDQKIIAGLLAEKYGIDFRSALTKAQEMIDRNQAEPYILSIFKDLTEFDRMPRQFELAHFLYTTLTSATNFAQLKRHRMMTLLPLKYNPDISYTIPESVSGKGLKEAFKEEMGRSSELFFEVQKYDPYVADYFLTNAHKREAVIDTSTRQLYAISRLREDEHAQWDIRANTHEMMKLAKKKNPLTTILLGGKNQFEEVRESLYKNK